MDQPGKHEEEGDGVAEAAAMLLEDAGDDTHHHGEPHQREHKQEKQIEYRDIH